MKLDSTTCETCPRYSDRLPSTVVVSGMHCTKANWNDIANTGVPDEYTLDLNEVTRSFAYKLTRAGLPIASLQILDGLWVFRRHGDVLKSTLEFDPPGAYAIATSLIPPAQGWKEKCTGEWKSTFMNVGFANQNNLEISSVEMKNRATSLAGASDQNQCICQAGMKLLDNICVCGKGNYLDVFENKCVKSPANHFQPHEHSMSPQKCPDGAESVEGSTSVEACVCRVKMRKIDDPDKPDLKKCMCDDGYYMEAGVCKKCRYCYPKEGRREYLKDCGDTHPGTCEVCPLCPAKEQTLVGCHARSPGKCTLKLYNNVKWLSAEPLCPEEISMGTKSISKSLDLGGEGFVNVFGASYENVGFACRNVCDGARDFDGMQCGGPYACNIQTCMQLMQTDRAVDAVRNDVLVCPVTMDAGDERDDELRLAKVKASCVACAECGRNGALEALPMRQRELLGAGWGRGCVRECSRLRCAGGTVRNRVWDWTVGACVACTELRDSRLCAAEDKEGLRGLVVSGHLPLLFFEGCKGGEFRLEEISYGRCRQCRREGVACVE
ncbi:MAG: hypothetical protein EBR09_16415, partial [Proteobacteria bacterium]|nr:hypothetical protein [Pseudomonadota bacterium]